MKREVYILIFKEAKLNGAYIIQLETIEDNRGFFARAWCKKEFEEKGINSNLVQCNISYNKIKGTLRGMHYQISPYQEAKLIRCIKGAIYDVIIDLRKESKTYMQWLGVELSDSNMKALYIPEGFAHGFITLTDDTYVFYQVSEFYNPDYERGILWNDPTFNIKWPVDVKVISEKDKSWRIYKK